MADAPKPAWWDAVNNVFSKFGTNVPRPVWLSILLAESTGNPHAHVNGCYDYQGQRVCEDSVGLFELNRMGGQGVGYSVEQLMDPATNAVIGGQYIAKAYAKDKSIINIAIDSGHPGQVAQTDARVVTIKRFYDALKNLDEKQTLEYLYKLPMAPEAYDPNNAGSGQPMIPPGTVEGIPSTVASWIGSFGEAFKKGATDQVANQVAPPMFLGIGALLVVVGLIALVFKASSVVPPEIKHAATTAAEVAAIA